jgi:hypothetical protein
LVSEIEDRSNNRLAATLDLLEDLRTRSDVHHLMLIGAYPDNEVTLPENPPLSRPPVGRYWRSRSRRSPQSISGSSLWMLFAVHQSRPGRSRDWSTRSKEAIRSS